MRRPEGPCSLRYVAARLKPCRNIDIVPGMNGWVETHPYQPVSIGTAECGG
jgi:hypothetical protein